LPLPATLHAAVYFQSAARFPQAQSSEQIQQENDCADDRRGCHIVRMTTDGRCLMIASDLKPGFSQASLRCRESLPSTIIATSLACGWTSVLVEHHRVEPRYEPFETSPTPDQTIVMMTRGEQDLASFNAGLWRHAVYRPGTIGMTPGGAIDRLRRQPRGTPAPFEKINLYIPQQIIRDTAEQYRRVGRRLQDRPLTALAFQDPMIAETVSALLRGMEAGAPDLYAEAAMQWLTTHLLAAHGRGISTEDRRLPGTITDKRLARVLDYMSAHFAEPLSLGDLAAEAGVSKFHFTRLFRACTGTTPHGFLVELRLDAARALLTTTGLSVAAIAARCGFARAAYFGTAFTKRFGTAPTAFRDQAEC